MVCFSQNFTSKMSLLSNFTQFVIFSYTQNVLSRGSDINEIYFKSIRQYKNKTVRTNTCSKTENNVSGISVHFRSYTVKIRIVGVNLHFFRGIVRRVYNTELADWDSFKNRKQSVSNQLPKRTRIMFHYSKDQWQFKINLKPVLFGSISNIYYFAYLEYLFK